MQKMLVIDGKALETIGTTMLIVSFALGSLIGEAVNLEAGIENLGEWLKRKTGSEGDNEFTNAFVSTSLTVCIGAMAIVDQSKTACSATGPRLPQGRVGLHHRLHHDGFARPRLHLLRPARCRIPGNDYAVCRRALPHHDRRRPRQSIARGSILIFCVGVNLIRPQTFRTANMLPSVVIAVIYALLF